MKLEIVEIGNALGLVLPDELLARHHLAVGDWVQVAEAADRSIRLIRCTRPPADAAPALERIMDEYDESLRLLARE